MESATPSAMPKSRSRMTNSGAGKRRLHERVVKPAVRKLGKRPFDHGAKPLRAAFGKPAQLDDREGLQKRVG